MANQGLLAQNKPAANTNTLFYSAHVDKSASTMINVANDGTASDYSVALKNFDQKLVVNGSANAYKLHEYDVITAYKMTVDTAFDPAAQGFTGGLQITSADNESKFRYESAIIPDYVELFVKTFAIRQITIQSVTGTFSVGNTITKGSGSDTTTAVIYGINGTILHVGPSTINGSGAEFAAGDSISNGAGASATVATGGVGTASNKFVFSSTSGGTYDLRLISAGNGFELFNDRSYRFNLADSTNSGHAFALSTTINGEWGSDGTAGNSDDGTEYTTGKTTNGTIGSSGAYIQYAFTSTSPTLLYWYNSVTGTAANSSFGGSEAYLTTTSTPTFNEFYIYDVEGTWTNSTSTFVQNSITYTVTAQTSGAYGYVRSYSGNNLYVIKGLNSADFAGSDTFLDNPKLSTATRSTVTVNSVAVATTAVENNYIIQGATNADHAVAKNTSIVVGPGERLIINSTTQNNTFSLIGFEDSSTAFTPRTFGS
jgi:hypothetical protein